MQLTDTDNPVRHLIGDGGVEKGKDRLFHDRINKLIIRLLPVKECVPARSRNSDGRDGYGNGRMVDEMRIEIKYTPVKGVIIVNT